ncbi:MAG: recombinase family protein [Terrisporobacter sp.]
MIYGYARVSTKGQSKDRNGLEGQIEVLKKNGCKKIYSDRLTGSKIDRPEFNKLLDNLKSGDMLVVTKLDRLARSMMQGSELVNKLIEKGIKVNILNIGVMDNTAASKLIRNIFFSFAEFEREMIVERTQWGKAIARTKAGFKEGRPKKFTKNQLDNALSMLTVNGGTNSYNEVADLLGISKSTLIRANNKRRVD